MKSILILSDYIKWHYTRTPKEIVDINIKFANFILDLFSVSSLLKRLLFIWLDILKKVVEEKDLFGRLSALFLYSFIGALEATFILLIIGTAVSLILIFALISVLSLGTWFSAPILLIVLPISILIFFLF